MADVAGWLSEILDDDSCRARSARAMGHVLQLKGKLRESLGEYNKALNLFAKLDLEIETAITLSSSLQPLILLSDYEESRVREEKARQIFKTHKDDLRLARLDSNLGNLLHRQDRFEEALVLYSRAAQALERLDALDDLVVVMSNVAVCQIGLHNFTSALETYGRLRKYSEQRQLQRLTVQADYNIAYLHYLQGEYRRAIQLYEETRSFCVRVGDPYHEALCDLDQAEIYLHLNLSEECGRLAESALSKFQALNMQYEVAKVCALLGLAACQQYELTRAIEFFTKARELFLLEKNWIWPPLVDLYRAVVLYRDRRWKEGLKAVTGAQSVLSHSALKERAALAEILRALLHMELGEAATGRYWAELALERVHSAGTAEIRYLAEFVVGCVREKQGDAAGARPYYDRAKIALSTKARDERIRPALSNDPHILYQHLLSLALSLPSPGRAGEPRAK